MNYILSSVIVKTQLKELDFLESICMYLVEIRETIFFRHILFCFKVQEVSVGVNKMILIRSSN